ncbi:Failed axon connections-like [Mizuhopecten yessoensis]|uniref:Failed axon connections-like n=1 Tax=Mizuhopecten yessoensis TaxID=6573 RepID=A0A210R223_MIZYE|nr:Failed axon connections-like [Mizuhopecten yessoensis]
MFQIWFEANYYHLTPGSNNNDRLSSKRNVPRDVVVLYQVGRGPRAPSISPFPLKLETFLRMAKIPYMNDHSSKFSKKQKTPWMEYNGVAIADSQFCIEHLKKETGKDVNRHLTPEQVGVARAFQKLTEENLYWTMCSEMFGADTTAVKSVIPYRGIKLWLLLSFLRRALRKEMWGHGIGRHTPDEIWSIAVGDMRALSHFIDDKAFLFGDEPCEADCAVFGMLCMMIEHMPTSRHERLIKGELTNLVDYCNRMKARYWPDWDKCILTGKGYANDSGKIYRFDN